jgi:ferredoxin
MRIKKLLLQFPRAIVNEPLVYRLAKEYNLQVNIFRAKFDPDESGYMVLDLYGTQQDIERGIGFIKDLNITINEKTTGLTWDETRCTGCGACIPHCPTQSLSIKNRTSMQVEFDDESCIECLNCIRHCPFGACSSVFGK